MYVYVYEFVLCHAVEHSSNHGVFAQYLLRYLICLLNKYSTDSILICDLLPSSLPVMFIFESSKLISVIFL